MIDKEWQLGLIAHDIEKNLMRFSRMRVSQSKEKYGTVRVYCSFGWYTVYSFYRPNYHHYGQWPRWIIELDFKTQIPMSLLSKIAFPWQKFIYRQVYKYYVNKYPDLKENILCCADYKEFLKDL